jgi:hypothetical protein
MTRGVAAQHFHPVSRAIQMIGEEAQEGLVGGRVDWWGGDFDAEFVARWRADLVDRRSWLEFDAQKDAIGLRLQESRSGHAGCLLFEMLLAAR